MENLKRTVPDNELVISVKIIEFENDKKYSSNDLLIDL